MIDPDITIPCFYCGNTEPSKFFITVFGYHAAFVECACGVKGNKRQGMNYTETKNAAIKEWNSGGQFLPKANIK